jgi:hypothetical protein
MPIGADAIDIGDTATATSLMGGGGDSGQRRPKTTTAGDEDPNPLGGLKLWMWDFAQCNPKRCKGAKLTQRGVFCTMPLRRPLRGIALSPNGTVLVLLAQEFKWVWNCHLILVHPLAQPRSARDASSTYCHQSSLTQN